MEEKIKLTKKQELFVNEYIANKFNGTQAAIACGYKERNARVSASRLLSNVNIQKKISQKLREILDKSDIKIARIIRELEEIAFSNVTDYIEFIDGDFRIKDISDMTGPTTAIASVSKNDNPKSITTKIKTHDKLKAIELLGKYYALWTENFNVTDDSITSIEVVVKTPGENNNG